MSKRSEDFPSLLGPWSNPIKWSPNARSPQKTDGETLPFHANSDVQGIRDTLTNRQGGKFPEKTSVHSINSDLDRFPRKN